MKRCLLALLFFSFPAGPHPWAAPHRAAPQEGSSSANTYDPVAFLAELQRISKLLEGKPSRPGIAELRDSLPKSWTVSTPEHIYSVSTQPLRNLLTALNFKKARAWVDLLADETNNFATARDAAPSNARAELNEILARREFAAVHPPTAWDLLRQRLAEWVQRLLMRLFSGMMRYPIGAEIIFWLAVAGGILWIAVSLLRIWRSADRPQSFYGGEPILPVRSWQEWLRTGREAAARGDFREAIHACYWAGIVRLQDMGMVPNDRAKTPREYLRLASDLPSREFADRSAVIEPLSVLTFRFERTWYANRSATFEDFQNSLRQLEALGCPLE